MAVLVAVAGELLAQTVAAFRGNTWQIRDLSGKKCSAAMFVNVLIVTDSQLASQIFGKGSQRMGGGRIGLLFLSLFLSVFLISFCLFLAESGCSLGPRRRAKE